MSTRKDVLLPYIDPEMNPSATPPTGNMNANIIGQPINVQYLDDCGIQFSWTGSNPIGVINLEVSMDYALNHSDPFNQSNTGTWTTVQTSPGQNLNILPGGLAGNAFIDFNLTGARWVRPRYTTAGGSVGSLKCVSGAKQV